MKGNGAFLNLFRVWKCRILNLWTTLKIYEATVLPLVLNGSETWKMKVEDGKKTRCF